MSVPSGVTIIPATTQVLPTRINSDGPGTASLLETYLAPLLTGLEIATPDGSQVGSFNFRLTFDGDKNITGSQAQVNWTAAPAS